MSETYGALQSGSNDAGSWQLIEQQDGGEWAPLARGGKLQIVRLAGLLNRPAGQPPLSLRPTSATAAAIAADVERERREKQGTPPGAGEWTIEQQNMAAGSSTAITREEVESWDQDRYLQRRGRLWVASNGRDYRDGSEHGRPYTTPAARMMTGNPDDHQPRLQLLRLRGAARDVTKTWTEQPATRLAKEWPAMNWLQQVLHELGADE